MIEGEFRVVRKKSSAFVYEYRISWKVGAFNGIEYESTIMRSIKKILDIVRIYKAKHIKLEWTEWSEEDYGNL